MLGTGLLKSDFGREGGREGERGRGRKGERERVKKYKLA